MYDTEKMNGLLGQVHGYTRLTLESGPNVAPRNSLCQRVTVPCIRHLKWEHTKKDLLLQSHILCLLPISHHSHSPWAVYGLDRLESCGRPTTPAWL